MGAEKDSILVVHGGDNKMDRPTEQNAVHGQRRLPTLPGLRAFEAAARLRSFKNAAAELCVTESSISHQVRNLERQVGVKLFERLHRRVALSRAGMEYMLVVSRAFSEIAQTTISISNINEHYGNPRTPLVVAMEPGFASHWFMPRLRDFESHMPDISIEIIPSLEPVRLLSERAVLAVHFGWNITGTYHCEPLAETKLLPVCAPEYLNNTRKWEDATLLHDRTLRMWGEWIAQFSSVKNIDWRLGPVFHSSAMCISAAIDGIGVSLSSSLLVDDSIAAGRLIIPHGTGIDPPGYSWHLVTESSLRNSDPAARFRDWLIHELSAFTDQ